MYKSGLNICAMNKKNINKSVKKRGITNTRKLWYVLIMVLLTSTYLFLQFAFDIERVTEVFATVIAIISLVAFWLEYNDNKTLNESQFIISLNDQFVSDERMFKIEWELEKFYTKYERGELTEEYIESFRKQFDIEEEKRQHLVNYLVHLEGVATLVNNGTLRISKISDLMSFRYFIAMNNPVVKEVELEKYRDYYRGCYSIYEDWVKVLKSKNDKIPMYEDFRLI